MDISGINFGFRSDEDTFASRGQKLIYWGPLKPFEKLLLRTPIVPWSFFASNLYYNYLWYPSGGPEEGEAGPPDGVGQALPELLTASVPASVEGSDLLTLKNLRSKFIISLLFGMVIVVGLMAYGDFSDIYGSLERFPLGADCPFSSPSRWATTSSASSSGTSTSARSASTTCPSETASSPSSPAWRMVITPGKLGEWLKSYLVQEMHGIPFIRTAPILLAERFTDSRRPAAPGRRRLLRLRRGVGGICRRRRRLRHRMIVARHRPTMRAILHAAERCPLSRASPPASRTSTRRTYTLFAPWSLILTTVLSFISWAGEVLAFYLVLVGLGHDGTLDAARCRPPSSCPSPPLPAR